MRRRPELVPATSELTLLRQEVSLVSAAVAGLREESRLAHQMLQNMLMRHAERLDAVEPTVERLDSLRQKGWAALSTVMVLVFLMVGSISSGFRWALFHLGIDLP